MSEFAWFKLDDGREVFRRIPDDNRKRATFPAPYVNSDVMEPTQHPCDGKYYSSKAKFRQITKAHGCIEMGNDPARLRPKERPKPKGIRESIKIAKAKVEAGHKPGERYGNP